jgi:CRISPR/Cas system CSM-associated protein Csm3 (group 7 of RAMP superfamily)
MARACYRLRYRVTAKTPLHLGSGSRTGILKCTLSYIPGSVIRGVVGTCLIKLVCKREKPLVGHKDCEFAKDCEYVALFGDESGKQSKVFFRNSYPVHLSDGGVFLPTRKTLLVCKNVQCGKVYDSLISPPVNCESCHNRLNPFKGFVCDKCEQRDSMAKPVASPISVSRVVQTAVDRRLNSAAQGLSNADIVGTLHSIDVVDAGTQFRSEIIVDRKAGNLLPLLKSVVEKAVPDEGLGGGKSRGLGKATFEEIAGDNEVTTEMLEKRASEIDSSLFVVRLLSSMVLDKGQILNGSSLLECARRAYSWCLQEGKPSLPSAELGDKRFEYEYWSAWSLKDEWVRRNVAISPGSVFQFKSEKRDKSMALALAALEQYAIGDFKPHGCGQVIIEKPR